MADRSYNLELKATDQFSAPLQKLQSEIAKTESSTQRLRNAFGSQFTNNVRNASFQIQDFFVQVGMGTSAMRAMSQQLPQLLIGFGTFGAVAGTVVALLPAVAAAFGQAEDKASSLSKANEDVNKAIGDVGRAARTFDLRQLYEEYNKSSVAARLATIEQIKFQQEFLRSSRMVAEKKFGESLEGIGAASTLDRLKGSSGNFGAAKLAEDLGIAREAANKLLPVLQGLQDGSEDVGLAFTKFGTILLGGNDKAVKLAMGLKDMAQQQRDAQSASNALSEALVKMGDGTKTVAIETGKARDAAQKLGAYYDEMIRIGRELNQEIKTSAQYWADLERKQEAARKAYYEATTAGAEAERKLLDQINKQTEGYNDQAAAITLTKDEILAKEEARLLEIVNNLRVMEGTEDLTSAYEKQIEAVRNLRSANANKEAQNASDAAAKAAADAWKRTAESISDSLTDALMRGFESGKDFARNLRDSLVAMFKTLILRPMIQAVMAPIAGGIASMFPGAASASNWMGGGGGSGASSLFGLGNLFGGGTSALGYSGLGFWGTSLGGSILGSTTAGGFGAGLIGGMGAPLATIGELMSGGTAAFGGAAGAFGAGLGAALPVLGVLLAIGAASGLFSRPHGPKTGGSASSGVDLDLGQLIPGDIGRLFTPNNDDASAQKLVDAVSQGYLQAARSLGLSSGTAQFAIGFDTDPQGTAGSRVSAQAMVNGRNVYNVADLDVGRDDAALQAALELESKRALLAALQASDLPEYLANVLNEVQVSTASSETIDQIIATAAALRLAVDAVRGLDEKFAGMDPEHIRGLVEAFGGLDAFAQNFAYIGENFYTTAQILERNTAKLADAFEALGLEVPDTHAAFLELLDGMDLTTEEGRQLYASVAALAPLFVAVEGTAQQAAEALAEVPDVLDEVAEAAASFADIGSVLSGAASQADQVISQIADMVGQLGGTLGERLASQIRITAEAASDYRDKLAEGINSGSILPGSAEQQAIEEIIRRLQDSNASASQQLARFTILTAQFDADRAEQLVALEKWYDDQRRLFSGNSQALAALQTTFGRRWQEIVDGIAGGVETTIDELAKLREALRDYLAGLRLNQNLSPLLPQQRLDEAQRQFGDLLAKAQGGDAGAMRDIQQAATAYLTEARNMFASGGEYSRIFESVMSVLTDLSREPQPTQAVSIDIVAGAMPVGSPVMSKDDADQIAGLVADLIAEVRASAKAVADRNDAAATRTAQIIVSGGGR